MPLCPQITNTPITVTQTADFTVTSVVPAIPDTSDGLAQTIVTLGDGTQVFYQDAEPTDPPNTLRQGDLWFDTNDGNKLYYYNGSAWVSAQDAGIAAAQTTADGKNKIFRQTTAPTATAIGDTWFDTDDGNKLYYWTGSAWVSVQDNAIATAQATADSKVKTFYQTTAPTASEIGDIWFDTDAGFKQYYWTGSTWTSVQDTSIAAAQAAATAAQTTADGKNKIYRQTTAPTGTLVSGDLWFDTDDDNRIYRYNGSTWVANDLGSNAIASLSANKLTAGTIDASVITVSNINAGNISTGTLNADRIAAASITGAKLVAGTITASQIAASTITGSNIAAATITGSNIAANTITASKIAAGTITATEIAAGTITATQISASYVYAGTIAASQITAGTLTGFTIQTSSGSTAIIMNGSSNALQFKVSGSVSGNIVPLGVAGILMHYGASPDPSGSTYPKVQMSFSTALLAASSSIYVQSTTTGNSASGDFRCFNAFQVDGNATFNGLMYAPNLGTSTSATNLRVATGVIGEIQETTASSIRFKENIVDLNTVFDIEPKKLLDLPVRAFSYKADYLSENDDRFNHMLPGFIAEEVDAIYPIAADYGQNGPHSWNERFIIPGMLALIQDLYKEIKLLKGE